ncbi:hypothetical protein MRB53_037645 [Persea americana]|nr:hypothetical protein MRB53_037645 [Persea americana]
MKADSNGRSDLGESATGWKSNSLPRDTNEHLNRRKIPKHVFQQFISRTKSVRNDDMTAQHGSKRTPRGRRPDGETQERNAQISPQPGTRETNRQTVILVGNNDRAEHSPSLQDDKSALGRSHPSARSNMLTGLMNSSTKAADGIGRAGKGLFGKFSRSGSGDPVERVMPEENYVFKVINLPLVEQTRITRISAQIDQAKDKTEFWMPALPWRCIEYVVTSMQGLR